MKVNCICGKEIYRKPSVVAKNITGEFYCSEECSKIATTKRLAKQHQKNIERSEEIRNKMVISKKNNRKYCIYCKKFFDSASFIRYHDKNCKSLKFDLMLVNLRDFSNYKEFMNIIRANFIRYHLEKNEDNSAQTAKKLNIERSHLYNLLNITRDCNLQIVNEEKSNLKYYKSAKIIIAKQKQFFKEVKINKARENFLELSEDELYTSMLPQYLHYMNLKEHEYDKSDLTRLPSLIQHYKDINAEDKVEDLEELLQEIKNKNV